MKDEVSFRIIRWQSSGTSLLPNKGMQMPSTICTRGRMFFWFVTISVIFCFAFLPTGHWLYERKMWRDIYFLSFAGIVDGILLLIAGIGMAVDWEIPMLTNDNAETAGKIAAKAGGKGAIVLLIAAVWPYFLILISLAMIWIGNIGRHIVLL